MCFDVGIDSDTGSNWLDTASTKSTVRVSKPRRPSSTRSRAQRISTGRHKAATNGKTWSLNVSMTNAPNKLAETTFIDNKVREARLHRCLKRPILPMSLNQKASTVKSAGSQHQETRQPAERHPRVPHLFTQPKKACHPLVLRRLKEHLFTIHLTTTLYLGNTLRSRLGLL